MAAMVVLSSMAKLALWALPSRASSSTPGPSKHSQAADTYSQWKWARAITVSPSPSDLSI